jgi:HJR/Mrr/RecB family endonuclease
MPFSLGRSYLRLLRSKINSRQVDLSDATCVIKIAVEPNAYWGIFSTKVHFTASLNLRPESKKEIIIDASIMYVIPWTSVV